MFIGIPKVSSSKNGDTSNQNADISSKIQAHGNKPDKK
jgi:hypothetical protein